MPHFLMVQTLKEFNGGKRLPVYGNQIFKSREKVILKKMADSLGVGFMAQFYRLKHFGMLSEHCMSEFIEKEMGFGGGSNVNT